MQTLEAVAASFFGTIGTVSGTPVENLASQVGEGAQIEYMTNTEDKSGPCFADG